MAEKACLCCLSSKGATRPETYPLDLIDAVQSDQYSLMAKNSLELPPRAPSRADLPNQRVALHYIRHPRVASDTPSKGLLGRDEGTGPHALCASARRSGYGVPELSMGRMPT